MKHILFVFISIFCATYVWAQDNKQANIQLLNAVNNNNIEQVVDACNKGADFLTFTQGQKDSLDMDNYLSIFYDVEDTRTNIVFDNFNLVLYESNDTIKSEILSRLASSYCDIGDYPSAELCCKEALQICKQVIGDQHPDYIAILYNLAEIYKIMGNFSAAERLCKEALQICKQEFGDQHPEYATSLNNLGGLYHYMGNYLSAVSLGKEALQIYKLAFGDHDIGYARILNNLAILYQDMEDFSSAEQLCKEALQIKKQVLGDQSHQYAVSLETLANLYQKMGDYLSAEQLYKEVLQINKNAFGEHHPEYATILNKLAILYQEKGDYSSAEPLCKEVFQICKDVFGCQNFSYATNLNDLAVLYKDMGDYSSAEQLFKEALQIYRQILGEQHPSYATLLNNFAGLYKKMKNYPSAEQLYKQAMQIRKKIFGNQHPSYARCMNNLSGLYTDIKDFSSAESLIINAWQITLNKVKEGFNFMSERQRDLFWKKEGFGFETTCPSFAYFYYPQKNAISTFAYDNELFLKGLLLNATQQVQNAVLESGDSILIDTYNQLRRTKEQILYLQQQPLNKQFGLDSLQILAEDLDKQLVLGCKEYRQSQKNISVTWDKVKSKLTDNDVAIEFSSFLIKEDSVWHKKLVALLLRKDSPCPEYIVIGNEEDIFPLLDEDADIIYLYRYNGGKLYSMIWEPLTQYIREGETVYFAPAGILHQINLSALPVNEKEIIGDKYNIVQLSSTRELAMQRDTNKRDKTILYGGLIYNVEENEMLSESKPYAGYDFAVRSLQDNSARDGVRYLSGTKTEVEQIENTCRQHSKVVAIHTSAEGNEESFKALSGLDYNILHIATHGFFFPNEDAKHKNLFMSQSEPQSHERYIDPLLRSGLLLAGANNAWTGHRDQLPEGVQDGILTAKEISLMNLGKADLVVLSACETGKGEVTSDGVFGLQRGFKQAGVNSLMMSLWKVDDKATQILMTEFYKNLFEGSSKIESLKKAQQYVKSQPGYEDPEYWAGFILLDALN